MATGYSELGNELASVANGVDCMSEPANWRLRAACRHVDPDLFFPEGTTGPALLAVERAKHLCGACPVQARCLNWALDHGATFGIWGGLTEGERRDLRRALVQIPYQRDSQHDVAKRQEPRRTPRHC